ncbi:hypothetical protein ABB37_08375 [Leptomonas pyrrhocoris]|uniref:Surface antigen-like protein n=1 Tax=Leptomonas pyrrhocoris TaxID=157538 RepID=A0A0M9FSZ1_LEPPY|nr:hypothetical protein ABB37_08375 [Leptomonas pyrrhocoris]XP_015653899.1 hypothetical protein ABB37_08375 [Leptomonas pyrrhocoris]KPA75459.1 hypothetical protein ABB37_08375 [Leptomonas pyrrhocoris]KPA75460.1 hypothetical protein ABB37_08375 [Leptomonas pyrrhocoris]|eukprot:XP_015653898.1 hypothetical protein ABB37_08375 [Leptomonas pyrrhocoris]
MLRAAPMSSSHSRRAVLRRCSCASLMHLVLLLVCCVLLLQLHTTVVATPVCTKWCLDCREYKKSSYCIQCINRSYVTDYKTHQCNVRPAVVPCKVPHCEVCVLNEPKYCYMCENGYQQKDKDLQCRPFATTAPEPTPNPNPAPAPIPSPDTMPDPQPNPPTTTATTTALCKVLWCSRCDPNDGTVCAQCYDGFTWKTSHKCEPTASCYVEGCLECDPMDSSVCLSCRVGYTESSSFCRNNALTNAVSAPRRSCASAAALLSALSLLILLL